MVVRIAGTVHNPLKATDRINRPLFSAFYAWARWVYSLLTRTDDDDAKL